MITCEEIYHVHDICFYWIPTSNVKLLVNAVCLIMTNSEIIDIICNLTIYLGLMESKMAQWIGGTKK